RRTALERDRAHARGRPRDLRMRAPRLRPRRLRAAEVDRAHAILVAASHALAAAGFPNWDPPYPLWRMRKEALSREVWLVEERGRAVGTYTVTTRPPHRYPATRFARGVRSLYLNRLAVVPARWGGGLGAALMAEIEQRARVVGARAVRFDAFLDNAPLRAFYRRLGYVERGPFAVGPIPVVCFEKELSP
ncbi:MAG: GNAT family N-acetyltransferase, partial [Myxococcales bacterium]|nr:GNAT family N-acetyltransferase [Myxococcales bacterium]